VADLKSIGRLRAKEHFGNQPVNPDYPSDANSMQVHDRVILPFGRRG
jgi:hypothetical protein